MTKETQLKIILNWMNIPKQRKEINHNNLKWMNRNLGIRNSNNPFYVRAMELIRQILIDKDNS